jgi:hypothetical protein
MAPQFQSCEVVGPGCLLLGPCTARKKIQGDRPTIQKYIPWAFSEATRIQNSECKNADIRIQNAEMQITAY